MNANGEKDGDGEDEYGSSDSFPGRSMAAYHQVGTNNSGNSALISPVRKELSPAEGTATGKLHL